MIKILNVIVLLGLFEEEPFVVFVVPVLLLLVIEVVPDDDDDDEEEEEEEIREIPLDEVVEEVDRVLNFVKAAFKLYRIQRK